MIKDKQDIKVLFYTCTPRAFRTTLIGHLYEVAQNFSVVLLSEKLDEETEKIIHDKNLFPKLEKIIQVDAVNKSKLALFSKKNRDYYKLAERIFEQEKPDILITSSDMHSLFEIYLNRLGKRYGSVNIAVQATLQMASAERIAKWFDLADAFLRFSFPLPLRVRIFLAKCRRYFGHFLCYWIFPLTIGEKPFFGKSSYILKTGNSGMRDGDYQFVFSRRDYDIWVRDGVAQSKIFILPHPLETKTREFFEKAYFLKNRKDQDGQKFITLILPDTEIGYREKDNSLISKKQRMEEWVDICVAVSKVFTGYYILLKPHPNTGLFMKDLEELLSKKNNKNIKIVNSKDPADKYVEISEVVIGIPVSTSTVLFTAHLQCPEKRIISIDFEEELLGDCYKNFQGIDYVSNMQKFVELLCQIKENNSKNYSVRLPKIEKENEISTFIKKIQLLKNING